MDVALFPRGGQSHLAFEIEMVLTADGEAALQAPGRGRQGGGRVAARHTLALLDGQVGGAGGRDVDGGRQVLIRDHSLGGSGAGGGDGGGGDGEQALADIGHGVGGEQLVVVDHRADVVLTEDVSGGQHQHHARRGAHGGQIHRRDPGMGPGADAEMDVQHPGGFRHVIDIDGRARHMARGAVVRQAGVHALESAGDRGDGGRVSHARSPARRVRLGPARWSRGTPCAACCAPPATDRPPRPACR